jgi:Uma2 family endonuclease
MPDSIVYPEVVYPTGDGEPMAETHIHVRAIMLLHQALEDFFHERPDVLVASDMFWYWEEGNSDLKVAPDVMVVEGLRPRDPCERRCYFSWEEGVVPAAVFEMASEGTWRKDLGEKRDRYQRLKVPEYFIFDPEVLYLNAPIVGFRLQNGKYVRMLEVEPGVYESQLGFRLRAEERMLRLLDGRTHQPILTREEQVRRQIARVDQAQALAETEKQRADAETQRAEAETQHAKAEIQRAESLQRLAQAEKQRAEAEKQRADALAEELEQLKKQLERGS